MLVRVALIQMRMSDDIGKNVEKAASLLTEATKADANIACLPELFTTTYFPQSIGGRAPYSDEVPGRLSEIISELAGKHKLIVVAGSIPESSGGVLYNTSFVIDSTGRYLGKYRKMHLPDDECFWEAHYFAAGDLGYNVFETSLCRIGVLICYDQWFPEPARILALKGAEIIFYPSAIGSVSGISQEEGDWAEAWETVQRGHAIANALPVAVTNRVGREGRIEFWGRSLLIDAFGKVIVRADVEEGVFTGEIDLGHGPMIRRGWGFLSRRRPKTYGEIIQ
ncbi:N-carbamoyl-D-amino acid hydrolase [Candidatus Calditenuaceae archaeon HR02]|nr:N-carbamoyl-D-amino acid hydrolase [Candidatus Calditenuaceae archaeon HR02]